MGGAWPSAREEGVQEPEEGRDWGGVCVCVCVCVRYNDIVDHVTLDTLQAL